MKLGDGGWAGSGGGVAVVRKNGGIDGRRASGAAACAAGARSARYGAAMLQDGSVV